VLERTECCAAATPLQRAVYGVGCARLTNVLHDHHLTRPDTPGLTLRGSCFTLSQEPPLIGDVRCVPSRMSQPTRKARTPPGVPPTKPQRGSSFLTRPCLETCAAPTVWIIQPATPDALTASPILLQWPRASVRWLTEKFLAALINQSGASLKSAPRRLTRGTPGPGRSTSPGAFPCPRASKGPVRVGGREI
jgi:hypothetical protein